MFVVASQSVMLIVLPRRSLRGAYATSQSSHPAYCAGPSNPGPSRFSMSIATSCRKFICCFRSKTVLRAGGLNYCCYLKMDCDVATTRR